MTETVSAVLVPVPEAERVVSRHRARLDAAAAGRAVPCPDPGADRGVPRLPALRRRLRGRGPAPDGRGPAIRRDRGTARGRGRGAAVAAGQRARQPGVADDGRRRAGKLADRGGVSAGWLGAQAEKALTRSGMTRTITRASSSGSGGGSSPRYFCDSARDSDFPGSPVSSTVPRSSTDWYGFAVSNTVRLIRGSLVRFSTLRRVAIAENS